MPVTLTLLDELRSRVHGELADQAIYQVRSTAERNKFVDETINSFPNVVLLGILEGMMKARSQCPPQSTC